MKQKAPLYTLDHGIEVIGEYAARGKNKYVRLRIRPHHFFPDAPVIANGILVRKNRVILAVKLGRPLLANEHAHHIDENEQNDVPDNLELRTSEEHNRHHKTGTKHRQDSKAKISVSLKKAFAEGRHAPTVLRPQVGESNPFAKLTRAQALEIRSSESSVKQLAKQYCVSEKNIRLIKNGVTWK